MLGIDQSGVEYFKGKRILFLGNTDNINLRLCLWSRKQGLDCHLWRFEEGERGGPGKLKEEWKVDVPSWMQSPAEFQWIRDRAFLALAVNRVALKKKIEDEFDFVVASGWHALIISGALNLPKAFVAIGYEVLHHCDLRRVMRELTGWKILSPVQIARSIYLWWLTRRALGRVQVIQDSFPVNHFYYRKLGVMERVLTTSFGDDCEDARARVLPGLRKKLLNETRDSRRVFLWFSRIRFLDPGDPSYKGADLFIEALQEVEDEIVAGRIIVFMGDHGEDRETFHKVYSSRRYYPKIRFEPHLNSSELATYLSLPNAVSFSEFGENNDTISGMIRDALSIGVPIVNSVRDQSAVRLLGEPLPRLYAGTTHEIRRQMRRLFEMPEEEYLALRKTVKDYADRHIDVGAFIPRLYRQFVDRLARLN